MAIWRLILSAADRGSDPLPQVQRLVEAVDDLNLLVQLGKELPVFRSLNEFQSVAELAVVPIGNRRKQSGGWRKRLQRPTA